MQQFLQQFLLADTVYLHTTREEVKYLQHVLHTALNMLHLLRDDCGTRIRPSDPNKLRSHSDKSAAMAKRR